MLKPALRLLACLMPFATGAFAADGGAAGFATKAAQGYMIEAATG
ncbi:D-alanyl-D-alanine carboxypeptidase, partial [Rhizobium ruizarguesonis]